MLLDFMTSGDNQYYSHTVEQRPIELGLFSGTCQYIYNDEWYNLVDMNNPGQPTYYNSKQTGNEIAYYNFCQSLSDTDLATC